MTAYDKAWHDRVIAKHLANKATKPLPDGCIGQHNVIDPGCERFDGMMFAASEKWG